MLPARDYPNEFLVQRRQVWFNAFATSEFAYDYAGIELLLDNCFAGCRRNDCMLCSLYKAQEVRGGTERLRFYFTATMDGADACPYYVTANESCLQVRARCAPPELWTCNLTMRGVLHVHPEALP